MTRARWKPSGGSSTYGKRPEVGKIIGLDFRAWRVLDITDVLPIDPEAPEYILGVAPLLADTTQGERHIMTVREHPPRMDGNTYIVGGGPWFDILPEHYSVCGRCGDVQPCREQWAEAQAASGMRELMRFDQPGICPACEEPITLRQKSIDLPNVVSPLGGIITFHQRWRCLESAARYEQRVLAAQKITKLTLSCPGRLIRHRDQTLECLDLECPNTAAIHHNFQQCYTRSHGCPRLECQIGAQ